MNPVRRRLAKTRVATKLAKYKHKKITFLLLCAAFLFEVCVWQLDHWCSPHIYRDPHFLLIALGYGMLNTLAYDLGIVGLHIAFYGAMVIWWFWED